MEDTSSTKEADQSPVNYPWSFHEVFRALLKCLGLENESHHTPKEQPNNINSAARQASQQEQEEVSTETLNSDPPNVVTDAESDPTAESDKTTAVSFAVPTRPPTSKGSGGRIN